MTIISASFFWRNDYPDGLGFTLDSSGGWTPEALTDAFTGKSVQDYFRDSDAALGSGVVQDYLSQLQAIALESKRRPPPLQKVILAALNIMYLADRGFIPNDEFNGPMFVRKT